MKKRLSKKRKKADKELLESEAKKHANEHLAIPRISLHNQIDSHKWANKMEILRLLST